MRFAERIGDVVAIVLMSLLFVTLVPFAALIRLATRRRPHDSHWHLRAPLPTDPRAFRRRS
jgi:hypothetical protein